MVTNIKSITTDKLAWFAFLATLVMTPLAVGTVPFSGSPFMVNHTSALHGPMLWLGIAITGILFAVDVVINKRKIRVHWSQLLLVVGGLAVVASTILSMDVWSSIGGNMNDELVVASWLAFVMFAFLGTQLVTSSERINSLVNTFIYGGWVIAGLTLLDQLFELEVFTPERLVDQLWIIHMGGGVFGNPDIMGVFLVLPTILAINKALSVEYKSSLLYWLASLMMSLALLRTLTRAAWLALAVGVLILTVAHFLKKRPVLPVFFLAIVATLSVGLMVSTAFDYDLEAKINTFGNELSIQSGSRATLAKEAISVIASRPFTGTGPANYRLGWSSHRILEDSAPEKTIMNSDAHSLPLQMAASLGLIASFALIAYIVYALIKGILLASAKRPPSSLDDAQFGALVALLSALIAASVSISNVSIILWIIGLTPLVVIEKAKGEKSKNYIPAVVAGGQIIVASVLIASIGIVPMQHMRGADAYKSTAVGENLLTVGDKPPYPMAYSAFGAGALTSEIVLSRKPVTTSQFEIISRAVEMHPNDAAMLYAAARLLVTSGALRSDDNQVQTGLSYALRSLDCMPYYTEAATLAAQVYIAFGDYEKANLMLESYADRVALSKDMQTLRSQIDSQKEK